MNSSITKWLNRFLVRRSLLLVPVPPSTPMLRKQASLSECRKPPEVNARDQATVADYVREVALAADEARFYQRAKLIDNWRCRCGKRLGEHGRGCAWHVNNRAQALTGEATEEQCR